MVLDIIPLPSRMFANALNNRWDNVIVAAEFDEYGNRDIRRIIHGRNITFSSCHFYKFIEEWGNTLVERLVMTKTQLPLDRIHNDNTPIYPIGIRNVEQTTMLDIRNYLFIKPISEVIRLQENNHSSIISLTEWIHATYQLHEVGYNRNAELTAWFQQHQQLLGNVTINANIDVTTLLNDVYDIGNDCEALRVYTASCVNDKPVRNKIYAKNESLYNFINLWIMKLSNIDPITNHIIMNNSVSFTGIDISPFISRQYLTHPYHIFYGYVRTPVFEYTSKLKVLPWAHNVHVDHTLTIAHIVDTLIQSIFTDVYIECPQDVLNAKIYGESRYNNLSKSAIREAASTDINYDIAFYIAKLCLQEYEIPFKLIKFYKTWLEEIFIEITFDNVAPEYMYLNLSKYSTCSFALINKAIHNSDIYY